MPYRHTDAVLVLANGYGVPGDVRNQQTGAHSTTPAARRRLVLPVIGLGLGKNWRWGLCHGGAIDGAGRTAAPHVTSDGLRSRREGIT